MRRNFYLICLFGITLFILASFKQSYGYKLNGVKWASGSYDYYINPTGVDDGKDYSGYTSVIVNGASEWSSVGTTNVSLNYMGTTSNTSWNESLPADYQNTVTWKTNGWSGSVIGTSVYWYSGGNLVDSDIKLNTAFAGDSRLPHLVTHEVGHSLGIGHTREAGQSYTTDEYNAIMYWQLHSQAELNQQDKCAITAIYPSGSCTPTYAAGYFNCIPCCTGESITVDATISNTSQTYSGTAKSVTVSTTPSGLSYSVTYQQSGSNVTPVNAGTYDVIVTITESGYEGEGPFYGTLTIHKKTLSVTANNQTVDYGSAEPTYTLSYSGFVNSETPSVLETQPQAYINQSWPVDPGIYTIYAGDGEDNNYNFSYTYGYLTVNGLSLNQVIVSDYVHTYDGSNKSIVVTTDPAGVGYSIEYKQNNRVVSERKNAGTYNVIITIDEPGYDAFQYTTTMTINKAPLLATADDLTLFYGDPEPTYTISYTGFVNDETETVLDTKPVADVDGTWPLAGGEYAITVTGGSDNNYEIYRRNGLLTINAFQVDSMVFSNLGKTYNGQIQQPTVKTYPSVSYQLEYYDENGYASAPVNAGTYLVKATITQQNYIHEEFRTDMTIAKATLNATASSYEITFGDSEPVWNILYSGFVNGENKTVLNELPKADSFGTWPLLPGTYNINLSGGADNNYSFNLTSGKLKINPARIDSVHFDQVIFTYNGQKQTPVISTYPSGKKLTTSFFDEKGNPITEMKNAGTYTTRCIVSEPGYVQDTFFQNLIINKAPLLVTANDLTVRYNDPAPNYTLSYNGFVAGEDAVVIDSLPTASIEGTWPILPGKYPIRLTKGSDPNYQITLKTGLLTIESLKSTISIADTIQTYTGLTHEATIRINPSGIKHTILYFSESGDTIAPPVLPGNYTVRVSITETGYEALTQMSRFTIQKAILTVQTNNKIINYGDAIPGLDYSITGYVNGETDSVLTEYPSLELIANTSLLPGNYVIRSYGGAARNYSFDYNFGKLTVNPLQVQSIAVTDTVLTYTGLPQNMLIKMIPDTVQYTIRYTDKENKTVSAPVIAGTYSYQLTVTETGYVQKTQTGHLQITPAPLQVRMDSVETTYGQPQPEIHLRYEGFVNGETAEMFPSLPLTKSITGWPWNAGTYNVELTHGEAANYSLSYQMGQITIHPAVITVMPDHFSISYNDSLPEFTYELSGFVNGEDEAVLSKLPVITLPQQESPLQPGTYPLIASGGEATNYTFVYEKGKLWIEPIGYAALSISDTVFTYSGTPHEITVKTNPDSLFYRVEYNQSPINAGSYWAKVTVDEPGYLQQTDSVNIIIQKALLEVNTTDQTILLGDDIPSFVVEINGFVNQESSSVIEKIPVATSNGNGRKEAGSYPIEIFGGEDNNYSFNYHNGLLTVIQTYHIQVYPSENGWVSVNGTDNLRDSISERVAINENSTSFYATPKTGFRFVRWDNGSTNNPITFQNVNQNISVTAIFTSLTDAQVYPFNCELQAFPNPVKENSLLILKALMPSDAYGKATINITDVTGRKMKTITEVKKENKISGLKKGIYFISLQINNKTMEYQKVIVK